MPIFRPLILIIVRDPWAKNEGRSILRPYSGRTKSVLQDIYILTFVAFAAVHLVEVIAKVASIVSVRQSFCTSGSSLEYFFGICF